MAWDSTAIVIAEMASIEGLLRRIRKNEAVSEAFAKGYREATQEQVTQKYWFSDDSDKLGKLLIRAGIDEFQEFENNIFQIGQRLEAVFANKALSEAEKNAALAECQQALRSALEKIQELNGGQMPFDELTWFLRSLKDNAESKN
jgi:hypothetical protein